jgi:hypothetical protein
LSRAFPTPTAGRPRGPTGNPPRMLARLVAVASRCAGPPYGLRGRPAPPVPLPPSRISQGGQFFVSPGGQFRMSLDTQGIVSSARATTSPCCVSGLRGNQRSHTAPRCVPRPDGGILPGPTLVSDDGQRMLPPRGGRVGSGCACFPLGLARSRSRRSSSRRARIVVKSSAARVRSRRFLPYSLPV